MTILWIAIWLAISIFILGIFVWTTRALFQQKRTWKAFAQKRGFAYKSGKFLGSASVSGMIEGNSFVLVSEERPTTDIRGRKFVTMLQFGLPVKMPAPAAIGSLDYRPFVENLNARDALSLPGIETADLNVIARSDDAALVQDYFTPERIKTIEALVRQKGVSVLVLGDANQIFIRLETIDPVLKIEQLNKMFDKIFSLLKVFY